MNKKNLKRRLKATLLERLQITLPLAVIYNNIARREVMDTFQTEAELRAKKR
jgi:hypothetical protein